MYCFKSLEEVGPIYKVEKNQNEMFQPIYNKYTKNGILIVDAISNDVILINHHNKNIEWKLSNCCNFLFGKIIAAFFLGDKLIISERKDIYVYSDKTLKKIETCGFKGKLSKVEPYNGGILLLINNPNALVNITIDGYVNFNNPIMPEIIKYPMGLGISETNTFLLTDPIDNNVIELNSEGELLWSYKKESLDYREQLLRPAHAVKDKTNIIYIADKYNNRIITVDQNKNKIGFICAENKNEQFMKNMLSLPRYLDVCDNEFVLISDYGNKRVIMAHKKNEDVKKYYGEAQVSFWTLGFPRGIDKYLDKYIVADSFRNMIYSFDNPNDLVCIYKNKTTSQDKLFWPRTIDSEKDLLISDTRNGRIVKLENEKIEMVINKYKITCNEYQFLSIADFKKDNGLFYVLDNQKPILICMDILGNVKWNFTELNDPHSICLLANQHVLVSDSGNRRVIEINEKREIVWECSYIINHEGIEQYLINPKFCLISKYSNHIIIIDSFANKILCIDRSFNLKWEISKDTIFNTINPYLDTPRWLYEESETIYLISDYNNRRVIKLEKVELNNYT